MAHRLICLCALSSGAALRLSGLITAPIWYDEAYSLHLIRFDPIALTRLAGMDFNPPLWELIAWSFVRLIGESEIGLRLPALLLSLVGLWLAWQLIQLLILQPWAQVSACVLVSLLPVMAWTAQDGRVYALLSTLYLAGLWFALRWRWLGFAACIGLICYCHNTGAGYAAALTLTALLAVGRVCPIGKCAYGAGNHVILASAAGASAFIPWLPAMLDSTGLDFWLGDLTVSSFSYALYQAFFVGALPKGMLPIALIGIGCSLFFATVLTIGPVLAGSVAPATIRIGTITATWLKFPTPKSTTLEPVDPHTTTLTAFALTPLAILFAVSMAYKNIIFYRPLVPLVIPVCMWLAGALTPRRLTVTTWIIPWTWLVLIISGLAGWSPADRGGDLRDAAYWINDQYQPGDVVYHAAGTSYLPFALYLDNHIPQVLINEDQNTGLLQTSLANAFGVQRAGLEDVPHLRAWIVVPRDPVLSKRTVERVAAYTRGAILIRRVQSWQFAPIEIYLSSTEEK